MRHAGRIARSALEFGKKLVAAGVTTEEIDDAVHKFILDHRAYPSPLNYKGFPRSCCTSVNEVVAHGIPNGRPLKPGDKINIDVTIYSNEGFHGDCSETLIVPGETDEKRLALLTELIEVARTATRLGIEVCGPNVPICNIGAAIETFARKQNYRVFPELTGHGIGRTFHTEPWTIPTIADNYPRQLRLVPGQCITVEPIIASGQTEMEIWDDNWTLVTKDKSLSAQFEDTILITETGYEILTRLQPSDDPASLS